MTDLEAKQEKAGKAPHEQAMAGYYVACKYGVLEARAFNLADDMYAAMFAAAQTQDAAVEIKLLRRLLRKCLELEAHWPGTAYAQDLSRRAHEALGDEPAETGIPASEE